MRVSGYEYLHNSVPDFNTSEKIDAATPSAERVDDIDKEEKAVTIDFPAQKDYMAEKHSLPAISRERNSAQKMNLQVIQYKKVIQFLISTVFRKKQSLRRQ